MTYKEVSRWMLNRWGNLQDFAFISIPDGHGAQLQSRDGHPGYHCLSGTICFCHAVWEREKAEYCDTSLCSELWYVVLCESEDSNMLMAITAPKVWLQSQDPYFPSDIGAQLAHTTPEINFNVVNGAPSPLTLNNLASLNAIGGQSIYLTSVDDITTSPLWLNGVMPDGNGKTNGATSCTVVVNDHGNGNVDAFYFYFFAFNQGNTVFGQEIGDHVGDWEHNMIRFEDGVPQAIWYSQHSYGQAFTYSAVEKQGVRPITYSAKGSHASYATTGYCMLPFMYEESVLTQG